MGSNCFFATKLNFLIPISLQPYAVDHLHFKLRLFDVTRFIQHAELNFFENVRYVELDTIIYYFFLVSFNLKINANTVLKRSECVTDKIV